MVLSKFYRSYIKLVFWKNFFFSLELALFRFLFYIGIVLNFMCIFFLKTVFCSSEGFFLLFFSFVLLGISLYYSFCIIHVYLYYCKFYWWSRNYDARLAFNIIPEPYFWKNTFSFLKRYRFFEYFIIYILFLFSRSFFLYLFFVLYLG